jgi:RNA polymerase sigma-70 factor (ECF subfamily)
MAVLTWQSFVSLGLSARQSGTVEFDFDSIRDYIFKLSYALTLDYSLAEDLAQDCLIKVWQHQHRLKELDSAEAWIAKVVANKARNYWRRRPKWLSLSPALPAPGEQDPVMIELKEMIGTLKPEFRDVILLVAVSGFTYPEAGKILDIPEGTVASRFSTAKKQLQHLMGDES